jgi:hypothetical protein
MLLLSFWGVAPTVSHFSGHMRLPRQQFTGGKKACCPMRAPVFLHYHKSGNVLSRELSRAIAKLVTSEVREPR